MCCQATLWLPDGPLSCSAEGLERSKVGSKPRESRACRRIVPIVAYCTRLLGVGVRCLQRG